MSHWTCEVCNSTILVKSKNRHLQTKKHINNSQRQPVPVPAPVQPAPAPVLVNPTEEEVVKVVKNYQRQLRELKKERDEFIDKHREIYENYLRKKEQAEQEEVKQETVVEPVLGRASVRAVVEPEEVKHEVVEPEEVKHEVVEPEEVKYEVVEPEEVKQELEEVKHEPKPTEEDVKNHITNIIRDKINNTKPDEHGIKITTFSREEFMLKKKKRPLV